MAVLLTVEKEWQILKCQYASKKIEGEELPGKSPLHLKNPCERLFQTALLICSSSEYRDQGTLILVSMHQQLDWNVLL